MKYLIALTTALLVCHGSFSQVSSGYDEKVRVFIEYNTGKMYNEWDVVGNANSWLSGLYKAPYKETKDTIYTYLIEDAEEFKRLIEKNSMAIIGDSVNIESFNGLSGDKQLVENIQGKVIVLNFWFKECSPCIAELPELNRLRQTYNETDVVFLAPTFNTAEEVNTFLNKREYLYNILSDAKPMIKEFRVAAYPTHILIDRNGIIKFYQTGADTTTIYSILDTEIKKLM